MRTFKPFRRGAVAQTLPMTSIAPLVARLLDLELDAEGHVPLGFLAAEFEE